jgi:hypothetical protein
MRRVGFVLFVVASIFAGPVATHAQERERDSVEVYLRTLNAKFVAYVKRMAADSVVTGEEMRNLIEGIEWFASEKEEADSALSAKGIRGTVTELVPGLPVVASAYRVPLIRHRDTDVGIIQSTLSRIGKRPIRSVEDDIQGVLLLLVVVGGFLLVALFVYGIHCNRVRYSALAFTCALVGYLFLEGVW